jgi:two-component system NtrC family response regulator
VEAVELARQFAPTELPILLIGATGTGKELLAQHIHRWSRRTGKLVDVNCAAIPQDIADSILFGHRRGAFSGAIETRVGLMEDADGGTLFLDELCSLALPIQGKLLRVLESGAVRRVGDTTMRLDPRVAAGSFRMDLLQRLGGIQIELPPLSERGHDIVTLAHAFAAAMDRRVSADGDVVLLAHRWPGNVRELRWAVERARWLTHESMLGAAVLEYAIALGDSGSHPVNGAQPSRDDVDVLAVCEAHGWDAARAADALGIHRTTLWRRLRALGISLRRRKTDEADLRQSASASTIDSCALT